MATATRAATKTPATLAGLIALPVARCVTRALVGTASYLFLCPGLHLISVGITCVAAVCRALHGPDPVALIQFGARAGILCLRDTAARKHCGGHTQGDDVVLLHGLCLQLPVENRVDSLLDDVSGDMFPRDFRRA